MDARRLGADARKQITKRFDSAGEAAYYQQHILPVLGSIKKCEMHRRFELLPKSEYCGLKLPAAHYTPDFVVEYADGTTEVVEVKSKFTRKMQRDFIYRRRLFIDLICRPNGWRYVEVIK